MVALDAFSGNSTKYISKNKQNIYDKICDILKDFIFKSMLKNEVLLFYLKRFIILTHIFYTAVFTFGISCVANGSAVVD